MKKNPLPISPSDYPYSLDKEKRLVEKVKIGDRSGAREILNELLGSIMFHQPDDFNVLKIRIMELLSVLSRAAVEAGADPQFLLSRNQNYINAVLEFTQSEQAA